MKKKPTLTKEEIAVILNGLRFLDAYQFWVKSEQKTVESIKNKLNSILYST